MCTYNTESLSIAGNAKSGERWGAVASASVYFDHPVAFPATHSLNIDFFHVAEDGSSTRRAALELSPRSARVLALAILEMLDASPPALLEE